MKKRILSLLLTLVMILGMIPATTLTANAAGGLIKIGSVELYAGQYLKQGSSTPTTTKPADNYAYFDGTTLELHNYTNDTCIDAKFAIEIGLFGYNKVNWVRAYGPNNGEFHGLTIWGNGTLVISGYETTAMLENLHVKSGNLVMASEEEVFLEFGVSNRYPDDVTYPGNAIALCSKEMTGTWEPFDLDKVKDKDYQRVMIISGVFFGSQSPAMPEGKTVHDLGKVSSEYVMTFASQDMPSSLSAAGYKVIEQLVVYDRDNNGKIVDTVTNNPQLSGTGISYSLKNLPSGNYRIRESITLYDKDGKALFGTNNDFILEVENIVNNINVSATFSGTPAKATTSTKGATVTATKWYKKNGSSWTALGASDTIKEGNTYRCEVTVGATGNYKLADGYTVKINGTAATKKSGNTWYRDVTITGYTSYVDVYDIDLPEAFSNPDLTYNDEEGAAYHWDVVQVEWFECDKDGHILSGALTENDVFKKDAYYRIEVTTVVTEANWQFHDTDLSFYINDEAAMPLYGYNKAYPDSVTGFVVYNTADIEGDYKLFVYDDSLSGSAKNIYIKDGQYLGSNATGATAIKPASGGYAYYKDGVLELNGYDNEKAHFIFEELALELYLVGDNTIGAIYDNEWGMAGGNLETRQGNLVIDAADGGKLTIASNPLDAYANIQVKDLYFKGGDVTSCLANGTYGAAVQLNGGNLYLENGYVAYVSNTNNFATATKWDGTTGISKYDCVWIVDEQAVSNITVNCIGDIDYTVSGNVVTVDHEVACKVGYPDGTAYKAIAAVANGNGTYSFTAPAGVTEVLLVVKGDVSGDGRVNMGDVSKLYAHIKGTNMLTGVTLFMADISNDGRINMGDVSKLYAHIKGTNLLAWDT